MGTAMGTAWRCEDEELSVAGATFLLLRNQWSLDAAAAAAAAAAAGAAAAGSEAGSEVESGATPPPPQPEAEAMEEAEEMEEEEAVEPMEAAAEAAATTAAESAATTSAEAATATEAEGGEPPQTRCGICFDDEPEPPAVLASLRCGHAFCTACWGSLLRVALEKGGARPMPLHMAQCTRPNAINGPMHTARCTRPPDCRRRRPPRQLPAPVVRRASAGRRVGGVAAARPGASTPPLPLVGASTPPCRCSCPWLPPDQVPRLRQLTLRSFVEDNTLLGWCPGAGCDRAVAIVSEAAPPEVLCECGTYYCAR